MTKTLDQLLFAFYAKNDGVRITDLHQGIVWGTQTPQTVLDERLINRFDYDGDYGTVLNRFLMQAAIGHPLTVHGTGGQTRAFIHIRDTVRCIEIAINNPPASGDRVSVFNQTTEVHRVIDLANLVSQMTGAQVVKLPNPRKEAPENDLVVRNDRFLALGLNPTTLSEGLLEEVTQIAGKYKDRVDTSKIVARSVWVKGMAVAPDLQLSPTSDRGVVSADEAVEQIGPTMLEGVEELAGETNGSSSRGDARAAGGGTTGKTSVPGNGAGNPRPARGQADRR
jgi:UDP-sulfoquinovose synthase